jgi:hypothetical protein
MAKKCEHLNVETKNVSGVDMAACKDCGVAVDPTKFEEATPEEPKVTPAKMDGLKRVHEYKVIHVIDNKEIGKPFFPVFDAKKGDVVVVLRKR